VAEEATEAVVGVDAEAITEWSHTTNSRQLTEHKNPAQWALNPSPATTSATSIASTVSTVHATTATIATIAMIAMIAIAAVNETETETEIENDTVQMIETESTSLRLVAHALV
jgi:hypothetical protein